MTQPTTAAQSTMIRIAAVDSIPYGGERDPEWTHHECHVDDDRAEGGRVTVTLRPLASLYDEDYLEVAAEVGSAPGREHKAAASVRLLLDEEASAALTVHKLGAQLLLVPGEGWTLAPTLADDGSRAFVVSQGDPAEEGGESMSATHTGRNIQITDESGLLVATTGPSGTEDAALLAHASALRAIVRELVDWHAEDYDCAEVQERPINGGDAVEWIGQIRLEARERLARIDALAAELRAQAVRHANAAAKA